MKHRKGKGVSREGRLQVIGRGAERALRGYFADQGQVLLPLLELVRDVRASIDELIKGVVRTVAELLPERKSGSDEN